MTKQLGPQTLLEKELFQLNRDILKTIIIKYPLRGYVVKVAGDQAVINLGSKQGVVIGTQFDILEEGEPVKYKDKLLQISMKSIARTEVIRVEPDLCYARILHQERPLITDDKVQEKIEETALR
jgi:hypothetical protein